MYGYGKINFQFLLVSFINFEKPWKEGQKSFISGLKRFQTYSKLRRSCEMIIVFLWSNFSILPFIEIFTENQTYVIFETNNGGQDLEKFKLKTVKEAVSILKQVRKYAAAVYITSNFLKAVFHKFYLVHSGILYPRCEVVLLIKILKKFDV